MATKLCESCQKVIPIEARYCPLCGERIPGRASWEQYSDTPSWAWVMIVLLVIICVLLSVMAMGGTRV